MYSRAWAVASLSVSWVFGDTSLTDNGNSSHAFILFIGVVWDFRHRIYMMRNTISALCAATFLCLLCSSCSSSRQVSYLQKLNEEFRDTLIEYDAHIMPKDLLTITVNTSDPDAAIPFNLTVATPITANSKNLTSQPSLQQYLVDNNGNIDFPVLGTLHIGGLTKSQAENMIKEKLKTYIKEDPIVNVRMANYKISVMGEVASPGTFTITNEKVNIMEALAMAGDMTVYGQRDKVKLIREDAQGNRQVIPLNLNDADIIVSPYYYLQQNDVVYVTPNKTKAKNAGISNSTTIWFSVVGTLVSLVSLIVTIAK